MGFTKETASAAGCKSASGRLNKKLSEKTVVRRQQEVRKAKKEAGHAGEMRLCEREAKLRQLEECVASQRKTGARQTACATAANVAGKSAQHSATAEDKKAWRQAKDVECREETPLRKCATAVERFCQDAGGDGHISVVWPDCGDSGGGDNGGGDNGCGGGGGGGGGG